MGRPRRDLSGQTFGRWHVSDEVRPGQGGPYWKCRCVCGTIKFVVGRTLVSGESTSCGCFRSEVFKRRVRKGRGESGANKLLYKYKKGAERRRISFTLTTDEFFALTSGNCYYCGTSPHQTMSTANLRVDTQEAIEWSSFIYNGIDRVDNDQGYDSKNCVTCCGDCNFLKSSLPQERFMALVGKIARHREL